MEVSLAECAAAGDTAANHEFRAFLLPNRDVRVDTLELRIGDDRADIRTLRKTVAKRQLPCLGNELIGEVAIDGLMDDDAARRRATLPRGTERGPENALRSQDRGPHRPSRPRRSCRPVRA